jgi:hypothetical protein
MLIRERQRNGISPHQPIQHQPCYRPRLSAVNTNAAPPSSPPCAPAAHDLHRARRVQLPAVGAERQPDHRAAAGRTQSTGKPAPFCSRALLVQGSSGWVATPCNFLLSDGEDHRAVHRQFGYRSPTGRGERYEPFALPSEVLRPGLRSRVEQRNVLPGFGIGGSLFCPLPQRTRDARQGEVACLVGPPAARGMT